MNRCLLLSIATVFTMFVSCAFGEDVKPTYEIVRMDVVTWKGVRAVEIDYKPTSKSLNMWNHIVEMYDIAFKYIPEANIRKAGVILIQPLIYSESDKKQNVTFSYTVKDSTLTPDWHVEFQPWFRDKKE